MNKGTAGAIGLVLLWISFALFFVAFHPGGLKLPNGQPATNPRDVILWFMNRAASGAPSGQAPQTE